MEVEGKYVYQAYRLMPERHLYSGDLPERFGSSFPDGVCVEPERVRDESGPADRMGHHPGSFIF